jgi:hypothetical protein
MSESGCPVASTVTCALCARRVGTERRTLLVAGRTVRARSSLVVRVRVRVRRGRMPYWSFAGGCVAVSTGPPWPSCCWSLGLVRVGEQGDAAVRHRHGQGTRRSVRAFDGSRSPHHPAAVTANRRPCGGCARTVPEPRRDDPRGQPGTSSGAEAADDHAHLAAHRGGPPRGQQSQPAGQQPHPATPGHRGDATPSLRTSFGTGLSPRGRGHPCRAARGGCSSPTSPRRDGEGTLPRNSRWGRRPRSRGPTRQGRARWGWPATPNCDARRLPYRSGRCTHCDPV